MAYVSRNPWLIHKTPAEALRVAGYSETATYIREVLRVATIDMFPTVQIPKVNMDCLHNQAVELADGRVCWYLNGDVLSGHRVIVPGSRSSIYVHDADIVRWFAVQPPVQQTLEQYFTELTLISEVPPCVL
jgi:hypothetical protein